MRDGQLEITDLLWSFDQCGRRMPVMSAEAVSVLEMRGQHRAAKILRQVPTTGAELATDAVDELGLKVHRELSRLGEELQLGRRVASMVGALLQQLGLGTVTPVRLVDVGCGLGQVLRSIAASGELPPYLELVGVDMNPVLSAEAARLARVENLDVRFVTGNAFEPGLAIGDGPRTVVLSTGLLHHLAADQLVAFFQAQAELRVAAFAHWDIAPCVWSTLGAWVFHQARMRQPVSRHDGVLSARRAHSADVLVAAAEQGAPGYVVDVREGSRWHPRALDVLRPIVGVRG
ncbi:methyltransferase domain-containing protein [Nocardioides sp. CER19]|uniref:methyltransferase domain-containing protein n=1 Tax=Nocardioides sp. CER19 TaxID=3038538 RepID=UPI00244C9D33|nr:methyltransferase domain-containing protein [Nocardioides sp. CER19]MDH2413874.1 methyltransferase domain-containing protein [Nocardioides sp. CER19]